MTSDSWHVWSSLLYICRLWLRCNQTCSIQFISEPRTCTKFITEQNQTLLIAILQTWYVLGNNPCSKCQDESLDKWPNFRCKNPPLGLLSQHDFEGRRKDSPRYTQFVLPHISWEVFWHTFQRNKVIKGESTFPGARHTSFIVNSEKWLQMDTDAMNMLDSSSKSPPSVRWIIFNLNQIMHKTWLLSNVFEMTKCFVYFLSVSWGSDVLFEDIMQTKSNHTR